MQKPKLEHAECPSVARRRQDNILGYWGTKETFITISVRDSKKGKNHMFFPVEALWGSNRFCVISGEGGEKAHPFTWSTDRTSVLSRLSNEV